MTRKLLGLSALGLIGLFVGISSVLLPTAIPLGLVGLAALLLLWVMPDLRAVPSSWTTTMFAVFAVSTLCIPSFYGLILPGLPWISLRRAVLFAWIVPFVIVLAGSSASRAYVYGAFRRDVVLFSSLTGLCAVMLMTTPTAIYIFSTINYNFNIVINSLIPMLAVVYVARDEDRITLFFKIAIFSVALNLIVGIVESHLQHPFLIYLLPTFMREQILAANPLAALAVIQGLGFRNGMYRASATYTSPLSWGEVSAMLIPACIHFVLHGRSNAQRVYGSAGAVMCYLSVYLSGSRGAYVGMIAALVAYSLSFALRSVRQNPASLMGNIYLVICSMLSGSTILAVLFVGRVRRVVLGGAEAQGSTDSRSVEWALAKPKILARPLTGYGGGSAGDVIQYMSTAGGYSVDGFYMNLLVDYGIFGCIFFFLIFLYAAFVCIKIYVTSTHPAATLGAAIGTGILAFVFYRLTLSQIDSLPLAFMLVGFTVALRQMTFATEVVKPEAHRGALRLAA